jgi:asparagine synthase (glutamine-hydrolysing)
MEAAGSNSNVPRENSATETMCGIAGLYDPTGHRRPGENRAILEAMLSSISHRGPDGSGIEAFEELNLGLGHRRLAIIDLSESGHQPMRSACGRYWVTFNGEIYNYRDLHAEFERDGFRFRGGSDTEVLLAGFTRWGVPEALSRITGMFAMAVLDLQTRELSLVRDRFGEKPLYYGWSGRSFLFGSELKALASHPDWEGAVDRDALASYFRHGYIPSPHTIYRGIRKVRSGCRVTFTLGPDTPRNPKEEEYWNLREAALAASRNPFPGTEADAVAEFDRRLEASVRRQMLSDVPLGAFLSSGTDSASIVAAMARVSSAPIRTFTIGFEESAFDESAAARKIAAHFGTRHTELQARHSDAVALIPDLPRIYDEPFADSSQIPTSIVAALTRKHVTVSLSGDGGDELFGGYQRYQWASQLWGWIGSVPRPARAMIGSPAFAGAWALAVDGIGRFLPRKTEASRVIGLAEKLKRLPNLMGCNSAFDISARLITHWKKPENLVIGGSEPHGPLTMPGDWTARFGDGVEGMMAVDAQTYLQDDIMAKVDRAAMSVSLETRAPFLDPDLFEFAWSLPLDFKIKNGTGKRILRMALESHLPPDMMHGKKMGFGIPLAKWLREDLRDWAEDLLNPEKLVQEGFLHPGPVTERWREHLSGRMDWHESLWDVLMFQAWLRHGR